VNSVLGLLQLLHHCIDSFGIFVYDTYLVVSMHHYVLWVVHNDADWPLTLSFRNLAWLPHKVFSTHVYVAHTQWYSVHFALMRMSSDDCWQVLKGRFAAVNSFLISCRCRYAIDGPAPSCHLGDGCSDLVVIHRCSRLDYTKHLYRCSDPNANQVKPHHVIVAWPE